MRKKPRIGDVIEIPTPKGFTYAHYTHKHSEPPTWGAVIRVLPGMFSERPTSFVALVQQQPQFITFFPLGAACNRSIVFVAGSEDIPPHAREFPVFRSSRRDLLSGQRFAPWFLWDGRREWLSDSLTQEQIRAYPPMSIINDIALIERILSGWRHEDDNLPNA